MIELAPRHKVGLPVKNPILLAGGTIGYGETMHPGVHSQRLGAVVIGPITLNSRAGNESPRLAEVNGGMVLAQGLQNRGLASALKQFAKVWPRLGCPVIAQIADDQPAALVKVAGQLTSDSGLSGLELLLPATADAEITRTLVRTATRQSDLPLWVKLPLATATLLAPIAVEAGAVGLVVGQPMLGAGLHLTADGDTPLSVSGALFGPLAFASMLTALLSVAKLALPSALIACGGIHTLAQVKQAIHAGAQAVQIDSAVWVEPGLPARLVAELAA
jgi:dihydroorotate dehydrogenase (NAD+) catalytic subunit